MTGYIQVVTTVANEEEAQRLALQLVERRLAACVQVTGPVASTYWWQGEIETATEWRCTIKSRADLYPQLEAAVRQLHSYHTPEILCSPVTAGNPAYLAWLDAELRPAEHPNEPAEG
ncbi:MAG TPA: divalent-cation tolerance protein CutA [Pirellulales bacterium]|jgi:periplasmic divalent cation tolerance protein|nr:divalent-cation tolerance protein CutA [Pirellulales bacterium]